MDSVNMDYVPYIGANGNWYVNDVDTGVKAQGPEGDSGEIGPQGIKGDTGEMGPQGIPGIQGQTGVNGLQGERGPVGATGPKGDTGAQGPQGIQGLKGDTGAQGPKGDTGLQGEKGNKGDSGPQGLRGETGPTGQQGIQGNQGVKGLKGDVGPQGPIGATPSLVANLTTTAAGKALDAIMGKSLNDSINDGLNGCKITYESGNFYVANGSVKKKLGEVGSGTVYTQDVSGTSNNFRGYGGGWIDYNITTMAGYTFIGGFIKYISVWNSNSALQKMNVEVQNPSPGVLRVLPVGDSHWPSGGNAANCTLTLVYVKN